MLVISLQKRHHVVADRDGRSLLGCPNSKRTPLGLVYSDLSARPRVSCWGPNLVGPKRESRDATTAAKLDSCLWGRSRVQTRWNDAFRPGTLQVGVGGVLRLPFEMRAGRSRRSACPTAHRWQCT